MTSDANGSCVLRSLQDDPALLRELLWRPELFGALLLVVQNAVGEAVVDQFMDSLWRMIVENPERYSPIDQQTMEAGTPKPWLM